MQEAAIRGALFCHKLRSEDKLFSWLFSIVRREALSYRAEQRDIPKVNGYHEISPFLVSVDYCDIESDWLASEERHRLRKAIHELDDHSKQIVTIKLTTESNLREIAQCINLNYHTTRSKYRRALIELRKALDIG